MDKIRNIILYTGCKYELIDRVFDLIPQNTKFTMNDVFGGSATVAMNAVNHFPNAKVIYNEYGKETFNMVQYLKDNDPKQVITDVEYIMNFYNLGSTQSDEYYFFRDERNKINLLGHSVALMDIILIRHSYSSIPRWSIKKGNFNNPYGERTWNYSESVEDMKLNHEMLQNIELNNLDYVEFLKQHPIDRTVDYYDPPYLITKANYNYGWNEESDLKLYAAIDERVSQGGKFILSNVIHHRGLTNQILIDWMKKYRVIFIDKSYNLSRTTTENNKTVEVIVTNLKQL